MFRSRVLSVLGVFAALLLLMAACATDESGDVTAGETDEAAAEETAAEETAEETAEGTAAESEGTEAAAGGDVGTITIGSTNFTEQIVLAEMFADLLEAEGYDVETNLNLGNREVVFPALEGGDLDLLPEYTGALLAFLLPEGEEVPNQPEEVVTQLSEALPEGLVALEASDAQDRDAFAVTQSFADENGVQTLADLADVEGTLRVGGPPELETRATGIPGLQEVYGVEDVEFVPLDAGGPLTLSALDNDQVDVGRVFTTQGTLRDRDLVVLDDPENLVPPQEIVPIAREDAVDDGVRAALGELMATLTEEDLIELNAAVDNDNRDPEAVAEEYLREQGLLDG